jgi:hypothetical protein
MTYASVAIVDESYPGELSLLSNHPRCFESIEEYKDFLIIKVTFSPMIPNDISYKNVKIKAPTDSKNIIRQNKLESDLIESMVVVGAGCNTKSIFPI